MKTKEFEAMLRSFAELPPFSKAPEMKGSVLTLAELFISSPMATVAMTAKKLASAQLSPSLGYPLVQDVVQILDSLCIFMKNFAKKDVLSDLEIISKTLAPFKSFGLESYIEEAKKTFTTKNNSAPAPAPASNAESSLSINLINQYIQKIESCIDDPSAFLKIYTDLENDKKISRLDVIELSLRITGRKSRSKPEALRNIMSTHRMMATFRAKGESRAGRSAA